MSYQDQRNDDHRGERNPIDSVIVHPVSTDQTGFRLVLRYDGSFVISSRWPLQRSTAHKDWLLSPRASPRHFNSAPLTSLRETSNIVQMKRPPSRNRVCAIFLYYALIALPPVCHGYPVAILCQRGIDLNGNNLAVDSYDSTDPTRSTGGQYDPSKAGDLGDVACTDGITNSLPWGSALIYGHLFIASNSPVMLGTSGGVGTHAWLTSNTGIEPGYELSGFSFNSPDTTPAYFSGVLPLGSYVTIGGATSWYDHILVNGDYYAPNLAGKTIVLGAARLFLPNGLSMAGGDAITISPGSSLVLYSGGSTCTVGGSGISNQDSLARGFVVYCSPAVSNLTLNASGSFIGVVVAPNADAVINAAGNNVVNAFGALLVRSLRLNGNWDFHFDEGLSARLQTSSPSNDLFQFQVVGVAGFHYAVQASTNLTSWVSLFTNALPFTWVDTNGSFLNRRFYRAMFYP